MKGEDRQKLVLTFFHDVFYLSKILHILQILHTC